MGDGWELQNLHDHIQNGRAVAQTFGLESLYFGESLRNAWDECLENRRLWKSLNVRHTQLECYY